MDRIILFMRYLGFWTISEKHQGPYCPKIVSSPVNNPVHEFLLLVAGALEVDARSLHRHVPQQVG